MESILLKRLAFFTNIYLLLIAVSVLVWINQKDSQESTQELRSLITLQDIITVDPSNLSPVIDQKAAFWVNENDTMEDENIIMLSQHFTKAVAKHGIYQNRELFDTTYQCDPSLFALAHVSSINHDSTIFASPYTVNKTLPSEAIIKELIHKVRYVGSETSIQYVKSFDEAALHFKLDSLAFSDITKVSRKRLSPKDIVNVESDFFAKRDLLCAFMDSSIVLFFFVKNGKTAAKHWQENLTAVQIPAVIAQSGEHPSVFTILDKPQLRDLYYLSLSDLNDLKEKYGNMLLPEAVRYLSEESIRGYKSISIFGFEFSKRRLPWVFGFFCLVAALGTYSMVDEARKRKLNVLKELSGDGIANLILEDRTLRFIIWCIAPLLVMYSAIPKLTWPPENLEYYIAVILIFVLGVISFIRSLKI